MEKSDYDDFTSGDCEKAKDSIRKFIEKNSQKFTLVELTTSGQWKSLWNAVFTYLKSSQSSTIHRDCLSAVRILSRDNTYLNQLLTDEQIDCLLNIANIGPHNNESSYDDTSVSIESLKCLCNLVFNSTKCQDMCLKNAAVEGIIKRIRTYKDRNVEYEVQYFDMKLLFLITALNPNVRTKVRDDLHGLTYLVETLDMIMRDNKDTESFFDKQVDLLGEILKVLFNLTVRNDTSVASEDEEEIQFRRLAGVLHDLFLCKAETKEKQQDLWSNCVNLLTNVPTACFTELTTPSLSSSPAMAGDNVSDFEGHNMTVIDILLDFLKLRLATIQKSTAQNEFLSPILTTLVKCVRCSSLLRRYIRSVILPPLRDVKKRPEEGNELRNYLCRLLTSPAVQVRDLAAELLFVMCKENVGRMIKYTGYGNAAGMFAKRGLLGGHGNCSMEYSSESEDSDTEEYKQLQHGINPVLGCYEPPRPSPFEGMTEEQKEHEAMKLVNLIDKLHRQGIMQPGKIGPDGRPVPVEHILQLQDEIPQQQNDHKRKT